MSKKLTLKQENFCQQCVVTGNKAEAYRRSYSAENMGVDSINAEVQKLFGNPLISLRVSDLQKEAAERNKITVDECVSLLTSMARFDIADCYDENGNLLGVHSIPKETRLAIEAMDSEEYKQDGMLISTTKKLKTSSRRHNIIELMKHLGGYEKDNDQIKSVMNIINLGSGVNPKESD